MGSIPGLLPGGNYLVRVGFDSIFEMPIFRSISDAFHLSAALLALLVLALGCSSADEVGPSDDGPSPPTVEITTVQARLLRDMASFSGQLSAEDSVMVKAETDGVVAEVLFQEGAKVEAGQVLIRLRDAEQVARLREAEANLSLAKEVFNRTERLAKRNAASQAARDQARAELGVARARVEIARVEFDRTEIRAPFDGVSGLRLVARGDRIDDDTPIVQVDAVDKLQVSFAISEVGILFTRVGTSVEIKVAPYPNEIFPGEVFFVSPTLDPATRRIIVKAWVPNKDRRLRAGLFANVEMQIDERENAILVPESAIVFDRQGTYVWKVDSESVAGKVPVETGLRRDGTVEVTLGLRSGERIVSTGTHKVKEGEKVVEAVARPGPTGQARNAPVTGSRAGEGT